MANKLLIIIGWLILGSIATFSQSGPRAETPDFGESDAAAIAEWYYRYDLAIVNRDCAAFREMLKGQFLNGRVGDKRWEVTEREGESRCDPNREGIRSLEARGWSHSEILQTRIAPLTADRALFHQLWRRWRKDGTPMEEVALTYVMCKASGVWNLCGILPLEPKYFGKEYRPAVRPSPLEQTRRQKAGK